MSNNKGYKLADGSYSSQYEVGDLFKVVGCDESFNIGQVVSLSEDDGEDCPWFKSSNGFEQPVYWEDVKFYQPFTKPFTKDDLKDGDIVHIESWGEKDIDSVRGKWVKFEDAFIRCKYRLNAPYYLSQFDDRLEAGSGYVSSVERQGQTVFQREPELIESTIKATAEQWEKINEILEEKQ